MRKLLKEKDWTVSRLAREMELPNDVLRKRIVSFEESKGAKGLSYADLVKISSILKVSLKQLATFE